MCLTLFPFLGIFLVRWQLMVPWDHWDHWDHFYPFLIPVISLPGIIAACQHCSDAAWALDLFREMVCRMLKPNTSSYNALLAACESATLWEECLCLLLQMEQQKLGDARFSQTGLCYSHVLGLIIERLKPRGCL
jgi:hypothetical protein